MTAYQKVTNDRDCLTVLPTGFGKSATYFLLPLLKDEVSLIHFHLQVEKDLQGEIK